MSEGDESDKLCDRIVKNVCGLEDFPEETLPLTGYKVLKKTKKILMRFSKTPRVLTYNTLLKAYLIERSSDWLSFDESPPLFRASQANPTPELFD